MEKEEYQSTFTGSGKNPQEKKIRTTSFNGRDEEIGGKREKQFE